MNLDGNKTEFIVDAYLYGVQSTICVYVENMKSHRITIVRRLAIKSQYALIESINVKNSTRIEILIQIYNVYVYLTDDARRSTV